MKLTILLLFLLLTMAACTQSQDNKPTTVNKPVEVAKTSTPAPSSSPGSASGGSKIQDVDFKNFTFPFEDTDQEEDFLPKEVKLNNGIYKGKNSGINTACMFVSDVQYGPITGEGGDQAVVSVIYGDIAGNYYSRAVYIYTLQDGKPKFLTVLLNMKVQQDFEKALGSDIPLFDATPKIKVADSRITIYQLADGSNAGPTKVAAFNYKWDGNKKQMMLDGKPELREIGKEDQRVDFQGRCSKS